MKEKLLKIQQEIGAIKKDSVNPHFKNRYFDINTLLAEIKPVLNKHGVVLIQGLDYLACTTRMALTTKLIDTDSKEEVFFTCPLPECADAQKYGSAITYFRRYALTSLLALEAEDDDATAVSGAQIAKPATKVAGTNIPYPTEPNSKDIGF